MSTGFNSFSILTSPQVSFCFFLGLVSLSMRSVLHQILFSPAHSSVLVLVSIDKVKRILVAGFITNSRLRCLSASNLSAPAAQYNRNNQNLKQSVVSSHPRAHRNFANFSTSKQKSAAMKPEFERLPKSVSPSHYELQLQPDLIKFTFAGSSKTTIKVSRAGTMNLHFFRLPLFRHLHRPSRRK